MAAAIQGKVQLPHPMEVIPHLDKTVGVASLGDDGVTWALLWGQPVPPIARWALCKGQ